MDEGELRQKGDQCCRQQGPIRIGRPDRAARAVDAQQGAQPERGRQQPHQVGGQRIAMPGPGLRRAVDEQIDVDRRSGQALAARISRIGFGIQPELLVRAGRIGDPDSGRGQDVVEGRLGCFLAHQPGVERRRQAAFTGDELGGEVVQVLVRGFEQRSDHAITKGKGQVNAQDGDQEKPVAANRHMG